MVQPKTLVLQLSDAAIKRHANDNHVTQLRDPRYPLRFRYSRKTRERGSWYVLKFINGQEIWRKAGSFPELTLKALLAALPDIQQRMAADLANATAIVTTWQTVGDLLRWYRERAENDRDLSEERRANVRSQITRHLLPALDAVALGDLNKALIDTRVIRALRADHALSTVRAVFQTLKAAFGAALRLGKLASNPLQAVVFGDFTKAKIQPKDGRLSTERVRELFEQLQALERAGQWEALALVVLMLAHGTRINETRLAKWEHFRMTARLWSIPAENTKTKRAHVLPLTPQLLAFLNRYSDHQQQRRGVRSAWLFPGAKRGQPISKRSAQNIFQAMGVGEWSSHDLRKLCRSAWADSGVEYLAGERLVNHAPKNLDATYIHAHLEGQKRAALEQWHTWLDAQGFALIHRHALSFGTQHAETLASHSESLAPIPTSSAAGALQSVASATEEHA